MKVTKQTILLIVIILCFFSVLALGATPYDNSSFAVIDSLELHYRFWPLQGEPKGNILLIHGLGGSTFSFNQLFDPLVMAGYNVWALDLPGFGYSERKQNIDYTRRGRTELIVKFINKMDLNDELVVMGHSMGGAIALELAYLKQLQGLVLVAPAVLSFEEAPRGSFWLNSTLIRRIAGFFVQTFFLTQNRVTDILNSAYNREATALEVEKYYQPLKIPGTIAALFDMSTQQSKNKNIFQDRQPLQTPTLVIWGQEDSWISPETAPELLSNLARGNLLIIEEAGHLPLETHFDDLWATLKLFLKELQDDSNT